MATKIKVNLDPNEKITVVDEVSIPTPDGKPLKIKFDFVYRNREEMADYVDEQQKRAKSLIEEMSKREDDGTRGSQWAREAVLRDVAVIKEIATGWNIDAEFDDTYLGNLCTKYPGAGRAIAERYRTCMVEGRLGN